MGGVVLRCTAKMPALLGTRPKDLVTIESSDHDWYANLLWLERRKCLLLAHAGTVFSVFVPDVRKSDLMPIGSCVLRFIHKELEAESLPLDRLGILDSRSIALAKTRSRTVLGYMNEMARFCEYAVADVGGLARCDARGLNRELRREMHLSRRAPAYFVPIELAGGPATGHSLESSIDLIRIGVPSTCGDGFSRARVHTYATYRHVRRTRRCRRA